MARSLAAGLFLTSLPSWTGSCRLVVLGTLAGKHCSMISSFLPDVPVRSAVPRTERHCVQYAYIAYSVHAPCEEAPTLEYMWNRRRPEDRGRCRGLQIRSPRRRTHRCL